MTFKWQKKKRLRNLGNCIPAKTSGRGLVAVSIHKLGSEHVLWIQLFSLVTNFL